MNKRAKKITIMLLVAALLVIGASTAEATCAVNGYVKSVVSSKVNHVIYVLPRGNLISSHWFVFGTTDDALAAAAQNAMAGNLNVTILGAAPTCPTTGANRAGGDLLSISQFHGM